MRWLRFAIITLLFTVLQAGLLAYLPIKPDLLLILLVFFAIYTDTTDAIIASFVTGFAADIIGDTMGPQIISFVIIGTALAHIHRVIAIKKMPYQVVAIFIAALSSAVIVLLLSHFKHTAAPANKYIPLFITPLCSAVVGPFLFLPLIWWMRIKTYRFGQRQ